MGCYNYLPIEIILKIYEYLNVNDIKSAGLTCHHWFDASNLKHIQNRKILKFPYIDENVLELFEKSFSIYPNILCRGRENFPIVKLIKFFSIPNISENVKFLILDRISFLADIKNLYEILKLLPKLEEIHISGFDDIESHYDRGLPKLIYSKIRSLKLTCRFRELSYVHFFSNFKTLEKLEIYAPFSNACYIMQFCQLCESNKECLKKLAFKSDMQIDFELLRDPLSNLKLTELSLHSVSMTGNPKFIDFIKTQNLITSLSLPARDLKDDDIVEVLKYLQLIERLDISENGCLTNATISEISKLENLKCLNINRLYSLTDDCILNSLAKNENFKIIELKCFRVRFSDEAIKMISENMPNLKILYFGHYDINFSIPHIIKNCRNVTDLDITARNIICDKCIHVSLPKLRHLKLNNTHHISPYIFNGMEMKSLKSLDMNEIYSGIPEEEVFVNMIKSIIQNAPSIEHLKFDAIDAKETESGYGLYKAVEFIISGLKQLKKLHIYFRSCDPSHSHWVLLQKYKSDLAQIKFTCLCYNCKRIRSLRRR